jgi:hypothetical protein
MRCYLNTVSIACKYPLEKINTKKDKKDDPRTKGQKTPPKKIPL